MSYLSKRWKCSCWHWHIVIIHVLENKIEWIIKKSTCTFIILKSYASQKDIKYLSFALSCLSSLSLSVRDCLGVVPSGLVLKLDLNFIHKHAYKHHFGQGSTDGDDHRALLTPICCGPAMCCGIGGWLNCLFICCGTLLYCWGCIPGLSLCIFLNYPFMHFKKTHPTLPLITFVTARRSGTWFLILIGWPWFVRIVSLIGNTRTTLTANIWRSWCRMRHS